MLNLVDSHVHFWDTGRLRYGWLANQPALNRSFLPDDFPARGADWQVRELGFVQADCDAQQGLAEAEWVTALAAGYPAIRGIVAFAPLERPEQARPALAALSRQPLVKGIRRLLQEEPLGFATQPNVVAGVQLLAEYGFSFDIAVRRDQLREAGELARQCPGVNFVLDHIGNPDIKAGRLDPWRADVAALAALPNVRCKVSGMVTKADLQAWKPADLRPYIDYVLEVFGLDRVMYGSDWPVQRLAASYPQWVEALRGATEALPEADRERLFAGNARAFYRLPPAESA